MTIERTAPRAVQDCPTPPAEDAWQSAGDFPARAFASPAEALEWAGYAVGDGDPELPAGGISARERQA